MDPCIAMSTGQTVHPLWSRQLLDVFYLLINSELFKPLIAHVHKILLQVLVVLFPKSADTMIFNEWYTGCCACATSVGSVSTMRYDSLVKKKQKNEPLASVRERVLLSVAQETGVCGKWL